MELFFRHRKFLGAYFSLVMLLLALGPILRQGRALKAPPSLNGDWKFEVTNEQLPEPGCLAAGPELQRGTMSFSQSGNSFSLLLGGVAPGAASMGVIEGHRLRVSLPLPPKDHAPGCSEVQRLELEAWIDSDPEPRSMTGILFVKECSTCGSSQFHAVRTVAPAAQE